ncbi:SWIM zinc finger family protein [Streptomyces sp. NPDC001492]
MTPGPADEARRALREAREHGTENRGAPERGRGAGHEPASKRGAAQEPGPAGQAAQEPVAGNAPGDDQPSERPQVPEGAEARPADAARAALRRAVSARRDADAAGRTTHAVSGAPDSAGPVSETAVGDTPEMPSGGGGFADAVASGAGAGGFGGGASGVASGGGADADGVPPAVGTGRVDGGGGAPGCSTDGAVPGPPPDDAAVGVSPMGTPGGDAAATAERQGEAPGSVLPDADSASAGGESAGEWPRAGARPADVAREALRAARAELREARVDAERAVGDTGRRSRRASAADRSRGGAPRRAAGVQARDLKELLAGAFHMPPTAAGPGEVPDDNPPAREANSNPRTPTSDEGPQTAGPAEPFAEVQSLGTARSAPPPFPGESPTGPTASRPHSMAAPGRDSELRRTFPAFAPRATRSPASAADARFAETWWGNAWVTALEEGALDAKRLARGRSYAEQGHVDAITVTPGLVLAYVQGSRPRPYRVQVRLRTLEDADWARFLDAAAERPGHIAALLDKELPQGLADCGVPLLPGPRDLDPHCSCPDRGHPCKHAAALCYQTARLLDADPFVLLLLRGRGERELLDALSRLSATRAARAAQEQEPAPLPGVRATEALTPRRLPPLPAPLPVPPHPEQPPVYPAAPGGPDPFALDQLATDAAARAHALLSTGRDPVAELTLWQDAVRLAAARPGSGLTAGTRALYASLASAAGRTPAELARAVAAWRQGGLEGLAVLEEPWDPPAGRFDRARPLLLAADLPAFRPWRNHLTHPRGHVQLRLGRDGLWYAYESEPGHDDWWPRGTPDLDPVGALTGLGTPNDL